ncbi:alkylmercury lyase family protein [Steroidobacter cummioxidans]|uniref:alkylmercury lyase family protein n=1 Tax=Steroidobacter cummioxidans TaxID=1803913 RepID=UPI0019D4A632|nr:alkylmercury lyase family protein [Steroidobacter cummioxidans]
MSHAIDNSNLHSVIIAFFLRHQRAPTISELASHFQCAEAQARAALRGLADYHGVVLHPNSDEIWVAHPFSAAPTTCVVRAAQHTWWGNCAWCSLGLAHLAGGTATIETRLGAMGEFVTVRIENGKILDKDLVVHFPIPMRSAWDNVIYTCSIMLLFRNESQVDAWCASRGIPKGDVRPVEQVWKFAAEWYARHADAHWTKWSVRQAAAMFERHGLTGPVWTLDEQEGRF